MALPIAALGGAGLLPMIFEDGFIFSPERRLDAKPSDYGLSYQDVWLRAGKTLVHAWHLPGGKRALVVFFHGNGGNIAGRLPHASALCALGLDVLLVEYPGYGRSGGRPSEASLYAAADAAHAWAAARGKPVVVMGESLGGAVAIDLAARSKVAALIVQSAFTSIADMVPVALPWLPFTPSLRNRFDSIAKIGRIAAPKLILHGDADDLVPFAQGERLFAAAREPKRFVRLEGAMHNDVLLVRGAEYFGAVDDFLRAHGL
ncbi:MAG: alpha/beta hydrolase [Dongiaceae bacterium]